jgi:hypothetical protein
MYAGEIKRLGYKETGTTGLINQHARQGSHKQSAEYVMDAANVEGYRDRHGERFTSIGDFLSAVEDPPLKVSTISENEATRENSETLRKWLKQRKIQNRSKAFMFIA